MAAAKKHGLEATVILMGPDGEPHTFGPDSDEIPEWAYDRIGDHAWEDGKKPAKASVDAKVTKD